MFTRDTQQKPKKSVAQIHRINTNSTAGIPVLPVKNPIEPKIAIASVICSIGTPFKFITSLKLLSFI